MDFKKPRNIVIIGGGAAGLMAAIRAAECGEAVLLLEKMHELGRKILISGKGRCNLTNQCERDDFLHTFGKNGRFLYSAWDRFDNKKLRSLLEEWGCDTVVERGQRVFPASQSAREVRDLLVRKAKEKGVEIWSDWPVKNVFQNAAGFKIISTKGNEIFARRLVLTTGGLSYPGTGSSGDGLRWARDLGHKVTSLYGALVPLVIKEPWVKDLQGLSLRNVRCSLWEGKKEKDSDFGEMLFTHFGVSGPLVLTLSGLTGPLLAKGKELFLKIDLKPALSVEQLDLRIQKDFEKFSRKKAANGLDDLLPQKMIPVMLKLAEIDSEKPVHQITRNERMTLVALFKGLTLSIESQRPIAEAIVTMGGVHLKEVSPQTMESKVVPNLYLAGEILDLAGWTGGFNLQAAFSTGWVAGEEVAKKANGALS